MVVAVDSLKVSTGSFGSMAIVLGDAVANVLTMVDGLAVIGGGISGAKDLFLQQTIDEINGLYANADGVAFRRLLPKAYNLEDPNHLEVFLNGDSKKIAVPGTNEFVDYDPLPRVGLGLSKLGTSKAIAIGAYSFALNTIDKD